MKLSAAIKILKSSVKSFKASALQRHCFLRLIPIHLICGSLVFLLAANSQAENSQTAYSPATDSLQSLEKMSPSTSKAVVVPGNPLENKTPALPAVEIENKSDRHETTDSREELDEKSEAPSASAATPTLTERDFRPPSFWGIHFQATTVTQSDADNNVPPYEQPGANGFDGNAQARTSLTTTLFLGTRVNRHTEFYFNPEVSGGSGLSSTRGIAGFPNGEIYRVDSAEPKLSAARIYLKHIWDLGSAVERISSAQNQIESDYAVDRLSLVVGKFSLNDFLDGNAYSHDPRTQFLNWSLMDNGAWDYAADTRGYTWGFMLEWNRANFAIRFASVLEPISANDLELDQDLINSHGDNLEVEYRYSFGEQPGRIRLLSYVNHAHMGSYQAALNRQGFKTIDVTDTRNHRTKFGVGFNFEQALSPEWGSFVRLGWNDGQTESWAFTEVDMTASGGLVWKPFSSREDRVGVALVANGLSPQHRRYLEAGGKGFILGEGGMNYALEEIAEIYYSVAACREFFITGDYQLVTNAGYNQDRSGVSILSLRMHTEY